MAASEPLEEPVRGATTRDVHEHLRRLILAGELEPGSEISQNELSRELSISRTPLREALRLLEREGLVVNAGPHRLVRISSLSMSDLDDLYSLRVMGEGLAIWLTVPVLRGDDVARLEHELELTASGDIEAHRRFHAGLRIGAGERLREDLDRLFEHAERYMRAFADTHSEELKLRLFGEHRAILDACAARDRQGARARLVDHLAATALGVMTAKRFAPYSLPAAVAIANGEKPPESPALPRTRR